MTIPILLLSDSVDCPSGLARITRDIAYGLSRTPEFRVATMGRGGRGSVKLPFMQYVFPDTEGWGQDRFEEIWQNFAGNDRGAVFTIWDASRLRWLVDKEQRNPQLVRFLDSGKFARWGYFPIDATGPRGKLTGVLADTIGKFDRVMCYGLWAKGVMEASIGRDVDWMPHGVNMTVFTPRERTGARLATGFPNDAVVVGMVATNQARKDWGVAVETMDILRRVRPEIRFWIHTDTMVRHWNLYSLIQDYGLTDHVQVTTEANGFTDEQLAWWYSACDLTMLVSSEGFGYPIVESQACGVPCVHGNYGGGAELVGNREWLVEPSGYRLEGIYNNVRPVFEPQAWVNAVVHALDQDWDRAEVRRGVEHLDWSVLWEPWKKWLLKGIGK